MRLIDELTKQEYRILVLVATGCRNAKISQELYISIRTVESHLYRTFKKLNVSSRTEAAIYAFNIGLLSNPELSGTSHDREERSGYYTS